VALHQPVVRRSLLKCVLTAVFPVCLIILLCLVFEPAWLTNDDAAMSMIAHGYGAIADSSSHLIFSNLLWGKFIQALPTLGGIYGYSLATYLAVAASGTVFSIVLWRAGTGVVESISLVSLILVGTVVFPQFTLTAGFSTVAGILCLLRYPVNNEIGWLLVAGPLLFAGFLIRDHEFALVALVSLPLYPWKRFVRDLPVYIMAGVLVLSISLSYLYNKSAYDGDEWADYRKFMPAATEFVAWDAGAKLVGREDILDKHSLSSADVELINNWLWFDDEVADPDQLEEIVKEIHQENLSGDWSRDVWEAFSAFFHPDIRYQAILAAFFLVLRPRKELLLAWFLFLAAVTAFGIMGRPAILRVYFPPLALLLLYPVLSGMIVNTFRERARLLVVIGCLAAHSAVVLNSSVEHEEKSKMVRAKLTGLPADEPVFGYYSTFKANQVFPVLGAARLSGKFNNLYLFGWTAKTPYSISYQLEKSGNGLKERLFSRAGVWMLVNKYDLFELYCRERGRVLETLVEPSIETGGARRVAAIDVAAES
jgi:hypothetical protein